MSPFITSPSMILFGFIVLEVKQTKLLNRCYCWQSELLLYQQRVESCPPRPWIPKCTNKLCFNLDANANRGAWYPMCECYKIEGNLTSGHPKETKTMDDNIVLLHHFWFPASPFRSRFKVTTWKYHPPFPQLFSWLTLIDSNHREFDRTFLWCHSCSI